MKYKMIEIGSGWVLESDDEGVYKYYDFEDVEWYNAMYSSAIQSKELIQQKYNELVLENDGQSEPTCDYDVNSYRQKVEQHFNAGGMCEWIDETEQEDKWEDYCNYGMDGFDADDFDWQTFNYRIKDGGDVNEIVNNSMSKRDMVFSEYQRISDVCISCDIEMSSEARLEQATYAVDLIISKVGGE